MNLSNKASGTPCYGGYDIGECGTWSCQNGQCAPLFVIKGVVCCPYSFDIAYILQPCTGSGCNAANCDGLGNCILLVLIYTVVILL